MTLSWKQIILRCSKSSIYINAIKMFQERERERERASSRKKLKLNSVRAASTFLEYYVVRCWKNHKTCGTLLVVGKGDTHAHLSVAHQSSVHHFLIQVSLKMGGRGGAVCWGTALQTGGSRVRFPIVSGFFIDIILSVALWHWGQLSRLSRNLGASTSWNSKGLSRPVMGLLFTYGN
jgi:hypothetical protein